MLLNNLLGDILTYNLIDIAVDDHDDVNLTNEILNLLEALGTTSNFLQLKRVTPIMLFRNLSQLK